ncbi:MAG: hypothetical protein ACRD47_11965 [Nitrososphaeraceae archaeon]
MVEEDIQYEKNVKEVVNISCEELDLANKCILVYGGNLCIDTRWNRDQ